MARLNEAPAPADPVELCKYRFWKMRLIWTQTDNILLSTSQVYTPK